MHKRLIKFGEVKIGSKFGPLLYSRKIFYARMSGPFLFTHPLENVNTSTLHIIISPCTCGELLGPTNSNSEVNYLPTHSFNPLHSSSSQSKVTRSTFGPNSDFPNSKPTTLSIPMFINPNLAFPPDVPFNSIMCTPIQPKQTMIIQPKTEHPSMMSPSYFSTSLSPQQS